MSAPLVQPLLYDLDATIIAAHKLADRIKFEVDPKASPNERYGVGMWHGLSLRVGLGATPAEALADGYAKLAAYLGDDAS